jgi:hypothetical protein
LPTPFDGVKPRGFWYRNRFNHAAIVCAFGFSVIGPSTDIKKSGVFAGRLEENPEYRFFISMRRI